MEHQSSLLFITFFLFLFLWLAKNYKQKGKAKTSVHKLPPGPWKLPLIGNLHQLVTASSFPYHAFQELSQKYGPLMHLQLGQVSAVVVSSPNTAKEIMKTHDLAFVKRPELLAVKILTYDAADIIFGPYGEYWRQMRKICMLEFLSAKKVQSFSFIQEDEVQELINSIQLCAGSLVNLTSSIFSMVSSIVCRASFGNKLEDQDKFLSLLKEVVELSGGFALADLFPSMKLIHLITGLKPKLEKIQKKLDIILEQIVKNNQEKRMRVEEGKSDAGQETLVEVLLRIQQSGSLEIPITTNNIKAAIWLQAFPSLIIQDIFTAGTGTSATILEWAMAEMMKNPRVMEKAQAEIRQAFLGKRTAQETELERLSYLKLVIRETIRLHPPAPLLLPREFREQSIIDGYEIPIKTKIIVNAWTLGRDPNYWCDAESFIPERFNGTCIDYKGSNFEFIPFGAGRRMCPGLTFGVANIELPLAALLYYFNGELPNGMRPEDLDVTECFGSAVGRKYNLFLILH